MEAMETDIFTGNELAKNNSTDAMAKSIQSVTLGSDSSAQTEEIVQQYL